MLLSLVFLAIAPRYRIVDLGVPAGADEVRAVAINNRGEVVVQVPVREKGKDAQGERIFQNGHGYLWREGRFLDFGEPKPSVGFDPPSTSPLAVNNLSAVVGWEGDGRATMAGYLDVNPFIWRGRRMDDLGTGWSSEPKAINDRGDVVGEAQRRGFARLNGRTFGIGTLSHVPAGNSSDALAINAHRLILGTSTYGGVPGKIDYKLPSRPFTIDGNRIPLRMMPLPLPKGFRNGRGVALNDRGTVLAIALYEDRAGEFAYLVRKGHLVRLPFAGAMNDWDEVVGGSPLAVWRKGQATPLPKFPGWSLQTAAGINDQGAICGTGLHEGKARAYVLLPNAAPHG